MTSLTTSQPSSIFSESIATNVDSLCIGSGRFLRSVLVPAMVEAGYHPPIIQTRGRTFLDYCWKDAPKTASVTPIKENVGDNTESIKIQSWTYEVDTVHFDGRIETSAVPFWGAGTLGSPEGKKDVMEWLLGRSECHNENAETTQQELPKRPLIIGVGVTEAGLSSASTKAMNDLYDILTTLSKRRFEGQTICVINTDNVSKNGAVLRKFMMEIAAGNKSIEAFLSASVVFHNTMVDRITSQRPGSDGLVPRAEPTPLKALVIEDLINVLPSCFHNETLRTKYGVVIRTEPCKLDVDISLKLRVANGTHTAVAHSMALAGLVQTDVLSSNSATSKILMKYLDSFFEYQILKGVATTNHFEASQAETQAVYDDWRRRLIHAHFGLSTFFITQNGAAKGGIRIGPTVKDLIRSSSEQSIHCSTAFCLAAILRFLTIDTNTGTTRDGGKTTVYTGLLDPKRNFTDQQGSEESERTFAYADGLSYNRKESWYNFRCDCDVTVDSSGSEIETGATPLPEALCKIGTRKQPVEYEGVVKAYLCKPNGGDLSSVANTRSFGVLVQAVAALYARMRGGDAILDILASLELEASCECLVDGPCYPTGTNRFDGSHPLHYKKASIPDGSVLMEAPLTPSSCKTYRNTISSVVVAEVASAVAIDLHTHLLPPTHGALCLWGIDELLTYHYLVAEYFVTAPPSVTPERFYALGKREQADFIWKALFIDRSPVSEACRGVVTTCVALGLANEIQHRDLEAIRSFYRTKFRTNGLEGAEEFSRYVFARAGIAYAVMTNIPFEPTETQHWRPTPKEYSRNFRSACRVDPLLTGNRASVETALRMAGYETTLEGAKKFLHDWCDTMKPEYLMASTPHNFVVPEDLGTAGSIPETQKTGVNEEAMKEPFAFANMVAPSSSLSRRNNNNSSSSDTNANNPCGTGCGQGDELASVINEDSDFLSQVLMKVCEERDLPLALKIGAHRGVNPKLLQAGDGVVAFADAGVLARLCTRFPNVRFLATFLSRANQHEACVLATKFRNLHLYGCWWFCNNPSIIEEITRMRVEMLGTAFTAQHSDSRVLDQLLYKWPHSRAIIADVLAKEYIKLVGTGGWSPTRGEIRRDVRRWFGASYEEFLTKSLVCATATQNRNPMHVERRLRR